MQRQLKVELWVGVFVLMTLVSLVVIALQVSNFNSWKEKSSYQVTALFDNIGGLKVRAPVKISGVVVGRVTGIEVDSQTYQARVTMDVFSEFNELPIDTSGSILTSGLLGDQYIGLEVGADEELLQHGDQLDLTQSALVLEELIGQFLVKFSESE